MKKISTLFFILISIAGFSQSSSLSQGQGGMPQLLQNKIPYYAPFQPKGFEESDRFPVGLPKLTPRASNSRSSNIAFYMDYGTLDSLYNVYGPNNGGGTWYLNDAYSYQPINTSLPFDSVGYSKWAFTWFPQIMDFINNPVWPYNNYDPNKIQMTLDTVYVTCGHVNTSLTNDTITVSIYDYDSFQDFVYDSGAAGGGTVLLGRLQIITDTSILGGNGEGTSANEFVVGTYPFSFANNPVVIPQGHRFIVQLNYNGPAEDYFELFSARRNDCGSSCGASHPYINETFGSVSYGLDSFNSISGIRYLSTNPPDTLTVPSTFYYAPCNGGTTKVGECEEFYDQDFDIYPNIKAYLPNFYVEGNTTPQQHFYEEATATQNLCPSSLVELTANGAGSPSMPYTFSWSTSRGTLSNLTGQQTTLTMDTSVNNDSIVVTLTDSAGQSVSDTFVVTSGGIAVRITNTSPIDLNCGQKVTIASQVSGSILGRDFSWSNGQSGISISDITDTVAGTFTVTVTNSNECSATASVVVDYVGTTNRVSFTEPTQGLWAGCPLTFVNTSTYYSNGWEGTFNGDGMGDDNVQDITTQDFTYTYSEPGVYYPVLTMDSGACYFSASGAITIKALPQGQECLATAVQNVAFSDNINLMPNPTTGHVHINITGVQDNVSIKVYNILGAELVSYQADELNSGIYSKDFDLSVMPSGTYLVQISSGDQTAVKKLVISR